LCCNAKDQIVAVSYYYYYTWREFLGEAPSLLEELLEMGLAVQHTVHGRVAAHLQAANAYIFAASGSLIYYFFRITIRKRGGGQ
jgi:hypothetical protein